MARTRSNRIHTIKKELIERLNFGFCRPGSRFMSNRELSIRLGVSYQTAHRLISELTDEGWLHRIPSSGTYVARSPLPDGVALVFHPNTLKNNFGGILLEKLKNRFDHEQISYELVQGVSFDQYMGGKYNIVWGREYDLRKLYSHLNYSLMIDATPEDGLNAVFTDCISVDHKAAGRHCAQILNKRYRARKILVLAGQRNNGQYIHQLEGFRQVYPNFHVLYQADWSYEAAMASLNDLQSRKFDAAFTVTDSAARALRAKLGNAVPVVTYGDSDVMETLKLDGMCIPWDKIVDETVRLYKLRSGGDISVGHRSIVHSTAYEPHPQWQDRAS